MPETDLVTRARAAVVALVRADAGVQAAAGRATRVLVPWGSLAADTPKPVLAYAFVDAEDDGGVGDTRLVRVQFAAFADDTATDPADVLCGRLLGALETCFLGADFEALDAPLAAVLVEFTRHARGLAAADAEAPAVARFGAQAREDLDVTLDVTA